MMQLYKQAVTDAMVADSAEVTDTLWAITPNNPSLQWKTIHGQQYVEVATFMRYRGSYPAGDSKADLQRLPVCYAYGLSTPENSCYKYPVRRALREY
jgi:hypothetical protein